MDKSRLPAISTFGYLLTNSATLFKERSSNLRISFLSSSSSIPIKPNTVDTSYFLALSMASSETYGICFNELSVSQTACTTICVRSMAMNAFKYGDSKVRSCEDLTGTLLYNFCKIEDSCCLIGNVSNSAADVMISKIDFNLDFLVSDKLNVFMVIKEML
ncbi:hypothetical protein WICPIJ_005130 [Wickerhamomyces pijperi]|uniref:Uncharacterized protein n=1 Tax=Wickerhamomyces pijperi TaxID=599730 RepID=A0A9P8TMA3_WICPI|nr:hypothetical protein WICPIJ_005130 [Wickerhamomyces pijperi]